MRTSTTAYDHFLLPLLLPSAVSIVLLLCRVILSETNDYLFLQWNLLLAWLPLLLAWLLTKSLQKHTWSNWRPIIYTLLWVFLLPNSFYMVSDFVHLDFTDKVSLMYDIVMLMSFVISGMLVGWVSVYMVQRQFARWLPIKQVWMVLGAVFLLSSFAVYLGRFLGWNSWDIVFNPADILFDVSDRVLNPAFYPNTYTTTSLFFVLITSSYISFYWLVRTLSQYK